MTRRNGSDPGCTRSLDFGWRLFRANTISVSRRAGRRSPTPQLLLETELNQHCVSHRTSSWKRKRKPQHSQSREYPEGQSGFGVHRGLASLILRRASSSQNQESATTPVARITNGRQRRTVYQCDAAPSRQKAALAFPLEDHGVAMEVAISNFCLPGRAQGEENEGKNVSPRTDTQTSYGDHRHPRQLSHRRRVICMLAHSLGSSGQQPRLAASA